MKQLYTLAFTTLAVVATACERRPLDDSCSGESQIPVHIDWQYSGITPGTTSDTDYVHRVTLRFFPKNGAQPFDRYLEGNVIDGFIDLPAGDYSVIVFNEALDDTYWNDAIFFTDSNNYTLFAANIVPMSPTPYDFYEPVEKQEFVGEPLKLASWSLDRFVVNSDMSASSDPNAMVNALTKVVLRQLYVQVNVEVDVTNLRSAMRIEGAVDGLSSSVNMASAQTMAHPSTHLFAFTAPVWSDPTKVDGVVGRRFLAFGALPVKASYSLDLGVVFVTGERYRPTVPLHYNVTQQVEQASLGKISIRVTLDLPKIDGGIDVGDWDDEEIFIQ